jgi:hypothetical protein
MTEQLWQEYDAFDGQGLIRPANDAKQDSILLRH